MIKFIMVYSWWNIMLHLHDNDNYIAKWKMPELSCNVKQKKKRFKSLWETQMNKGWKEILYIEKSGEDRVVELWVLYFLNYDLIPLLIYFKWL